MSVGTPATKSADKKKRHQRSDPKSKKRRWSAEERASRGRKPRRRGGTERPEGRTSDTPTHRGRKSYESSDRRPTESSDRRSYEKSDRKSYDRSDRKPYEKSERKSYDRSDRKPYEKSSDRSDRKPYEKSYDRSDRKPYEKSSDRSDRKPYEKSDRKSYDRSDRKPYEKSDRKSYDRSDRKPYEKSDRKSYDRSDRKPYEAGERKSSGYGRSQRPAYANERNADRGDRFAANQREDRFEPAQREERIERPAPVTGGFVELGVAPKLADRLAAEGISTPFPIQAASIPDAVSGRDVLGRGRTGSGKTLGFGLPLLTRLAAGRAGHDPRGLILLPTRELATQVSDVLRPLARELGLRTLLVAGGMSYAPQLKTLESGVDIIIGTPGRLIDLMDRGALLLNQIEITVLDEADHMADLGFLPDVTTLLDAVPSNGQRMLFSATLDRGVDRLVATYLHDPSTHQVDSAQASVDTMKHVVLPVAPKDKRPITAEIANRPGRTVIFVRTQLGADRVAEQLRSSGVMAGPLHGGLPQGARNRTLEAFKTGRLPVLVATDVAARGIHVDEVGLVLQVDPPTDPKTYLHRAGRTARAGEEGVVVTLVLPDQRRQVRRLAKDAGVAASELDARPGDSELADATGAAPTTGARIDDRDFEQLIAPRQNRSGGRPGGRRGGRPGDRPQHPRRSGGRPSGPGKPKASGKQQRRESYDYGR